MSSQRHDDQRRSSITQSFTSEDSQTVILSHQNTSQPSTNADQKRTETSQPAPPSADDAEPAKCWICFTDETEDGQKASEWRSPCQCSLKAHESCLLDWVANLDNKNKANDIKCPQCKGEIRIWEPRNRIADFYRTLEGVQERGLGIWTLMTAGGTIVAALWAYGFTATYLVLGVEDAERLLGLSTRGAGIDPGAAVALPFIPLTLLASQIPFVGQFLSLTGLYLPNKLLFDDRARRQWPPSIFLTLSGFSTVRTIYKMLKTKYVKPIEDRWEAETKGRTGGDQDANRGGGDDDDDAAGGVALELGIQIEIEEEIPAEEADGLNAQGPAEQRDVADGAEPVPNPDGGAPAPGLAAAPEDPAQLGGNQLFLNARTISSKALAALSFPFISYFSGLALKMVLPRTWTTPPGRWDRYPVGLLQTRLGRTLVGGCLFVLFKDTLSLHSKYHYMQARKHRKVLNHKGGR